MKILYYSIWFFVVVGLLNFCIHHTLFINYFVSEFWFDLIVLNILSTFGLYMINIDLRKIIYEKRKDK